TQPITRTALAALRCMWWLDIPPRFVVPLAAATCAPTPPPRGLQARRLRAAARRLRCRYRRLPPREGGCAAGRWVNICASELRPQQKPSESPPAPARFASG